MPYGEECFFTSLSGRTGQEACQHSHRKARRGQLRTVLWADLVTGPVSGWLEAYLEGGIFGFPEGPLLLIQCTNVVHFISRRVRWWIPPRTSVDGSFLVHSEVDYHDVAYHVPRTYPPMRAGRLDCSVRSPAPHEGTGFASKPLDINAG